MILLIDNYDSFTYNLYQYIGIFDSDIQVIRNDCITIQEIETLNPARIVLSPGPKSPCEAGICLEVIRRFGREKPILGICLGHQCIGAAYGAAVGRAKKICHGKQSAVTHVQTGLFAGLPSPIHVARYHSLSIQPETVPECLQVTARSADGEIMAVRHRDYPVAGLQFHPESVYTEHGRRMIENFLNDCI